MIEMLYEDDEYQVFKIGGYLQYRYRKGWRGDDGPTSEVTGGAASVIEHLLARLRTLDQTQGVASASGTAPPRTP